MLRTRADKAAAKLGHRLEWTLTRGEGGTLKVGTCSGCEGRASFRLPVRGGASVTYGAELLARCEGADELFSLGQVLSTPGAQALPIDRDAYLGRHHRGDWGDLNAHDKAVNERGLKLRGRLHSAYDLPGGRRLWIITEHDRSATTLLLPEEN